MVAKSSEVSTFGCIDKFSFGEGHEVEVLDAFLIVVLHATAEGLLGNDLTDILEYKIIWFEVDIGAKAVSLFLGLDY